MGEVVEHGGAQLLGLTFGFNARFIGQGAITVEGDGYECGDGAVGERGRFSAKHHATDGHGTEANDATADSGAAVVVRGAKVVDVLRHFPRIERPTAGRVDLLQIRIEYGD